MFKEAIALLDRYKTVAQTGGYEEQMETCNLKLEDFKAKMAKMQKIQGKNLEIAAAGKNNRTLANLLGERGAMYM